jgi:membrane associated rhomboid family serine protease
MSYRPNRGAGISPILVIAIVNVIIFVATIINEAAIFQRFGLVPIQLGQEPWTLFTYMFVHSGIFHLLFNMITLYFFGRFVMALVGETSFLTTYFIGGICGGLVYLLFSYLPFPYFERTQFITVVGASGAIYALGGLLVAMRPNTRVITFPLPIAMPLWVAILIGFLLISFYQGIAWQAHLGGLVYGLAVGFYFRSREFRRRY